MERVVRSTAQSFRISPQLTGGPAESRDRFSVSYLITAAARVICELATIVATLTAKYHAPEGCVFRLLTAGYLAGKPEVSDESVE